MPTTIQPDMFDDLRAQHDFVEKQKEQPDPFNLIVPEAFVQSIRDLGYRSTYTALDELVDNAVQANAKLINVFPAYIKDNKSQKKPDYIVIADDGHGMEPDMIRLAVKWGGTHRHDDRRGFGRFGFGLPSSCVSIGRAYTVYSKPVNGAWHAVTVDIDEVAKKATTGKGIQTNHRREQPPKFVLEQMDVTKFESGTVIVIETLDRLDRGSKLSASFVRNAMEHFGVVYRKMIPTIDLRVAGDKVQPVDPLFLDPNGRWYDDWPIKAQPFEGFAFEVKNSKGETGEIRVRGAWFPFNFHLKDPNGPFNGQNRNDRFKIMKEYNGILICRAGRQIDFTTSSPWHTFVNFDRFWKIEIDFDPVLDEMFGITTHKQQIVMSESVETHLEREGIERLITDLRRAMMASRAEVKAAIEKRAKEERLSEEAMKNAQKKKPRAATASTKQAQKAEENLELQAKKQSEVTGEPVADVKKRLADQAERFPYKVGFEAMVDGPIFRAERMHKQYRLILNTTHRFYTDIYEVAEKVPGLKPKIETLLFVLAEMELDAGESQEAFFKSARMFASQRLTDVLADLDHDGDREDEAASEMEDAEVAEAVE